MKNNSFLMPVGNSTEAFAAYSLLLALGYPHVLKNIFEWSDTFSNSAEYVGVDGSGNVGSWSCTRPGFGGRMSHGGFVVLPQFDLNELRKAAAAPKPLIINGETVITDGAKRFVFLTKKARVTVKSLRAVKKLMDSNPVSTGGDALGINSVALVVDTTTVIVNRKDVTKILEYVDAL